MKIDKIFILHYEPLEDRKKYLDSKIFDFNIDHEFIISNKASDLNLDIGFYYKENNQLWKGMINQQIINVTIKHFEIYQKILKSDLNYCLILEDDAVFVDDFINKLSSLLDELKNSYFDICFISSGCHLKSENIIPSKKIYESNSSRTASGYIINREKLDLLIRTLPFYAPIDWHLNFVKNDLDLKYYWAEPHLVEHGTDFIYNSSIR